MIQKKNQAARIADIEVGEELLGEAGSVRSTSPTSKTSKVELKPEVGTGGKAEELMIETHHPQVIDQDVENFTTRLDTLICQFRNESLKEFLTVKRSILHEQIHTIENEKKRSSALLSTKQDELQHLSENLNALQKSYNKSESQKEALSLLLASTKLHTLALCLKVKSFKSWFAFHKSKQHKRKTYKLIQKYHRRAIINYVYLPWKLNWKQYSLKKAQKKFNERLEIEKSEIAMHFNKEIEMLTRRLGEAEKKIEVEEESKVAIQESLKKAFMRGVCAMNFEAMNILNPAGEIVQNQPSGKIDFFDSPGARNEARVELRNSPEKANEDLLEISVGLPAESKELKWKAAPVFGRPQTAQVTSEPLFSSNLPIVSATGQTEGKVIVINNSKAGEAKITGKVPIKSAIVKKK